jgi:hypothetical protein
VYLVGAPSNDDDFEAIVRVEMNVQACVHRYIGFVLHIGQDIAQAVDPMIVNQRNNSDHFGVSLRDLFLDEMITNKVAYCLGTILIPEPADALIKRGQEIFF